MARTDKQPLIMGIDPGISGGIAVLTAKGAVYAVAKMPPTLHDIWFEIGQPFDRVLPQTWQGKMGCRTGGDKNISKAAAQRLFPKVTVTHAIADALLLAEYARRLAVARYPTSGAA